MLKRRSDGRLIKSLGAFYKIIPYIIETRTSAMNQISIKVDIENTLEFLKKNKDISLFHTLLAAIVRTVSQRPAINRFVAGRRIYARNSIDIAFTVKKRLTDASPETVAKVSFLPSDTIYDVAKKVSENINMAKSDHVKSDDALAELLMKTPRFVARAIFYFLKLLEYYNALPKKIIELDPFHSSTFVSNLGSLGIGSVNHHLYEWGTISFFVTMGRTETIPVAKKDGTIATKRVMPLIISCDDRICDGLYYSRTLKLLEKLIQNPTLLENPPDVVIKDVV
jgi:pyruvate/2-oxoglutarate dehydrogenase complex dihydrolipoamide acyltransferase (E2) component